MIPDFSRGTVLGEKDTVLDIKGSNEYFAILRMEHKRTALFLDATVFEKLKSFDLPAGFLDFCFKKYENGYYYISKTGYNVFSAKIGPYADNEEEVLNLCSAFKAFNESNESVALNDIVYIEEYNILLPIVTGEDDSSSPSALIGSWLSDGFNIDASDFDRICLTNQWLPAEAIEKAITAAGFMVKKKTDDEKEAAVAEKPVGKTKTGMPKIEENFILPGREKLTKYFNDQIVDFIKNIEKYERMGIRSVPATLLYGKPGCGKTYAVEKLADFLDLPVFEINSSTVASPYIHDTSKKIAEVFAKAMDAAPSILIIDEVEAYVSSRANANQGHQIEEVDEFLRNIPKAIDAKVIIFAMTNMIDAIDPAILRKGRFDYVEEVGMPTLEEVTAVLSAGLKEVPADEDIDIEFIAEQLLDRPMSDVAYIIRQGARIAVKEDSETVCQEHLEEAIESLGIVKTEPKKPNRIGFDV